MSQTDTRNLSHEARVTINRVVMAWIVAMLPELNETCVIAEVFNGKRKNVQVAKFRERLHTYLRTELRVQYVHGRVRSAQWLRVVLAEDADGEGWVRPSLPLLGAMMGVDHSALVARKESDGDSKVNG